MWGCDYEDAVVGALIQGSLEGELRQHSDSCLVCGELVRVFVYLETARHEEPEMSPLPSAGLIWWRARLAEKRRRAERSVAGIDIVQKIGLALMVIVAAVLMAMWSGQGQFGPTVLLADVAGSILLCSAGGVLYAWLRERI